MVFLKINNIIVTFWFNKVTDIKNKINYFEEELKEYFNGINSNGVPADINPDYPRLTAISDGGHTTLNVSMINLQLVTRFDDEYNLDYEMCFDYIKQRILKIYDLLIQKLEINILYGAIAVLGEIDIDKPMQLLKDNLLSQCLTSDYFEAGVRLVEVIDNKYYKNLVYNTAKCIKINKVIDSNKQEVLLPLISMSEAKIEKENISINYEINDKYMFDKDKNYNMNFDNLLEMIKIAKSDIKDRILSILKK